MQQLLMNQYEMLSPLGKGGTGEVWLVKDLHLNRLAAAKRIKNPDSDTEETYRVQCFQKEMELLREFKHPGLPAVYDFFLEQDWLYLIMEYIEGITLRQYLQKNGKVMKEQALEWAIELTKVLGYLHDRRPAVVYRDLKPENIMIKPDGEIKLIDLGACMKELAMGEEREGSMGTFGYAPQEQWKAGQIGKESDIYALGVVLYEMLTGTKPAAAGYIKRSVCEYDAGLSKYLDQVIGRCTKENPKDRYQSMEQVKEALIREKGIRRRGIWQKSRMLIEGSLLSGFLISLGWPLIEGIEETKIPFPYLDLPILFLTAAILLQRISFRSRGMFLKKIEKSILATEKKFEGLI